MSKKLSGLCLVTGLILGGAGDHFAKSYINRVNNKEEIKEDNKLVGILNLKTKEVPYLPIGNLKAYDDRGISYAIFYNTLKGTVNIRESKRFSNNSFSDDNLIVIDNDRISF